MFSKKASIRPVDTACGMVNETFAFAIGLGVGSEALVGNCVERRLQPACEPCASLAPVAERWLLSSLAGPLSPLVIGEIDMTGEWVSADEREYAARWSSSFSLEEDC